MIGISVLGIAKIFVLFALGLYIIFALVVIKQVSLMTKTVEVGLEGFIKLIAWGHLIFAVVIFFIALTIL
ncbi:MAG: hypothetical protein UU32_C0049G0008 [Candidatus Woesebacteria bacterium GW2011_GWB1_41_10]|uniref:Integral membrane protein n=1 Tax=Candidatus Woesebacteria bacterium GW2011_GWB1_41_10 TaxID=1618577 RepID=A0A0G0WIJ1_9BACT|nr:MAG: hypothetical protein UU32_C0049G0008 [Candidatus Woesebacteria bacterium GW2011_GWB1_41_10]